MNYVYVCVGAYKIIFVQASVFCVYSKRFALEEKASIILSVILQVAQVSAVD